MARGRTAEVRVAIVQGLRDFGPIESNNATGTLAEKLGIEADTIYRDALKQLRDSGQIVAEVDGRRTKKLALGNGYSKGEEFGEFETGTPERPAKTKSAAKGNGRKGGQIAKVATTPYAEALITRKEEIQTRRRELADEMDALADETSMIDDLLERAK